RPRRRLGRDGRPAALRVARGIAADLAEPHTPAEPLDVLAGGWAGLLLELECARPAFAVVPGRPTP
ncbi:hypothetical protein, partial [Cellulomonas sp. ICMP 17802]|uniref:hypothetical protein n=1 Tax=Cellulomonas sp. ICMP 17802 TaxID=3239199 RepID=UPI00351AF3B4